MEEGVPSQPVTPISMASLSEGRTKRAPEMNTDSRTRTVCSAIWPDFRKARLGFTSLHPAPPRLWRKYKPVASGLARKEQQDAQNRTNSGFLSCALRADWAQRLCQGPAS